MNIRPPRRSRGGRTGAAGPLPSLEPLVALRIQILTQRKPFISRRTGTPLRAPGFYSLAVLLFAAALAVPILGHERSHGDGTATPTAVEGAVLERFERSTAAAAARGGAGDVGGEVTVDELLLEDVYRTLAGEDDD